MPKRRPEIVVVDYDAGNLRSVQRALEAVAQHPLITSDPRAIDTAAGLVLPGVGSAQDCMRKLAARELVEPLRAYAASGRPFLGVCVGLQLLFDGSEEGGGVECLGIVPGTVRRFPGGEGLKVPQIGWNSVRFKARNVLLDDIPDHSYFYFVHSYYAEPADPRMTIGETDFGITFAAIVARDNLVATQFHPEKSAEFGLRIYRNFGQLVARGREPAAVSGR